MSFDFGMGRCAEITDDFVIVKLDSVLVHKWFPLEPWRRPGTSLLKFDRKLCSAERPPQIDQEIYINSESLKRKTMGSLDLDGVDPMPPPAPKPKSNGRR